MMAKYLVAIPKPSAKRMAAFGKIIVRLHDGFDGDKLISYDYEKSATTFEFEVPDKYEWYRSTSVVDGWSFSVSCEYTNSTETRKETKELVPQRI